MSVVKTNELTGALVRMKFNYDQETGLVTYSGREREHLSPSARSRRTGKKVGWFDSHGYLNVKIGHRDYLLHRVIWLHQHGEWPSQIVDHINGDKTDNRISNLRLVNQTVNSQNQHRGMGGSASGVLGVSPGITPGTWLANIRANKVPMRLGTFDSIEYAQSVYLSAKALVHPESNLIKSTAVDLTKFNKTAERNLRRAGYWPA